MFNKRICNECALQVVAAVVAAVDEEYKRESRAYDVVAFEYEGQAYMKLSALDYAYSYRARTRGSSYMALIP